MIRLKWWVKIHTGWISTGFPRWGSCCALQFGLQGHRAFLVTSLYFSCKWIVFPAEVYTPQKMKRLSLSILIIFVFMFFFTSASLEHKLLLKQSTVSPFMCLQTSVLFTGLTKQHTDGKCHLRYYSAKLCPFAATK